MMLTTEQQELLELLESTEKGQAQLKISMWMANGDLRMALTHAKSKMK